LLSAPEDDADFPIATPESLAKLSVTMKDILTVLPPSEVEDTLRQAGFEKPIRFFQSFMMMGWWAQKNAKQSDQVLV
jgi:hypothetical protein